MTFRKVLLPGIGAPSYTRHMAQKADEVYRAGLELDLDERTVVAHSATARLPGCWKHRVER